MMYNDIDFLVDRFSPQQVGDQTNAGAAQPVAVQAGDVAVRLLAPSKGRNGIVRVIRRYDVQHARGVCDATRYGAGFVLRGADGENAATAHQATRGPDANQIGRRRWGANRLPGVTPGPEDAKIGGNGRPRPPARPSRRAQQIVRVTRLAT